ncbi:ATP-binding protein [Candidatus Micrarchaeota archaeon]|nr:ATP-binding protein [Candidatus Micrarchaeota archaeon]
MKALLVEQNPWWSDKLAIHRDKHVVEFEQQKVRFEPPLLDLTKGGVYVLRGPRQVGKTTLLKLMIKSLLEAGGANPQQVAYANLESGTGFGDLAEYVDFSANQGRRYLFVDEATAEPGWAAKVKYLVDSGKMTPDDVLVVTGSSSLDLKKGAERLPGRGIEGNEYLFYPYSFARIAGIREEGVPSLKAIEKKFLDAKLHGLFTRYLRNGGFPPAWNQDPALLKERYARWIEGAISKEGKSVLYARELLEKLTQKTTFDFLSLARETSIVSHHTVASYLDSFNYLMIGKLAYNYNAAIAAPDPKKEKKFLFTDPLLSSMFGKRLESLVVEDVVGSHLLRVCDQVCFYRDKKREVDYLCKFGNEWWAVEVKWSENLKPEWVKNLAAFKLAQKKFLLTKNVFEKRGNVVIAPTYAFLAAIGKTVAPRKILSA